MKKEYVKLLEKHIKLASATQMARVAETEQTWLFRAVVDDGIIMLSAYTPVSYYDGNRHGNNFMFTTLIDGGANFCVTKHSYDGRRFSYKPLRANIWGRDIAYFASDEAVIREYIAAHAEAFGAIPQGVEVFDFISDWQYSRANTPLAITHKKKADKRLKYTAQLKPMPTTAIDDFIENELFPNAYGVYKKKADKEAYCSYCGRNVWAADIRHNGTAPCRCGKSVIFKNTGIMQTMKRIPNEERDFTYIQGLGDAVCLRVFSITKIYADKDYDNFRFIQNETLRVFVDKSGVHAYKNIERGEWTETEVILEYPNKVYVEDIAQELEFSMFKYSELATYLSWHETLSVKGITLFLKAYKIAPILETLIKLDLQTLTKSIVALCPKIEGNTFSKAFGISSSWISFIRQHGLSYSDIKALALFKTADGAAKVYRKSLAEWRPFIKDIIEVLGEKRYISYLLPKCTSYNAMSDYVDYLHQCKILEYDLKDKNVIMPRSIAKAHEKTTALVKFLKDEKLDKLVNKVYEKNKKVLEREIGEYVIRPVKTREELIHEGSELHHCVGGYCEKIIAERCYICLIRKKAAQDTPYYTMELTKDLQLTQCRTRYNASYSQNAVLVAVINEYLSEIRHPVKPKRAAAKC